MANDVLYISAFSDDDIESIVGVDVDSGNVVLEFEHANGNMIDFGWSSWDASLPLL